MSQAGSQAVMQLHGGRWALQESRVYRRCVSSRRELIDDSCGGGDDSVAMGLLLLHVRGVVGSTKEVL